MINGSETSVTSKEALDAGIKKLSKEWETNPRQIRYFLFTLPAMEKATQTLKEQRPDIKKYIDKLGKPPE